MHFETWNPINPYGGSSFKIIMGENAEYQEGCRNYILPIANAAGEAKTLIAINAPSEQRTKMEMFLHHIETQCKITPSKTREANGLTIIQLNEEWIKTPLRYSFLTMLLKIGLYYEHPDRTGNTGLNHIYNNGVINDWKINMFYINSPRTWERIRHNVGNFMRTGCKLSKLDKYSWNEVKPKYEKNIGFINCVMDNKTEEFVFKGEVE